MPPTSAQPRDDVDEPLQGESGAEGCRTVVEPAPFSIIVPTALAQLCLWKNCLVGLKGVAGQAPLLLLTGRASLAAGVSMVETIRNLFEQHKIIPAQLWVLLAAVLSGLNWPLGRLM